mmetsp:Transcript_17701/g.24606  ORF Transcript_17701/g.24606 Transcript_17701/m.24606 type:complete len:115 (-) Transcript_17701:1128-1472(-)
MDSSSASMLRSMLSISSSCASPVLDQISNFGAIHLTKTGGVIDDICADAAILESVDGKNAPQLRRNASDCNNEYTKSGRAHKLSWPCASKRSLSESSPSLSSSLSFGKKMLSPS